MKRLVLLSCVALTACGHTIEYSAVVVEAAPTAPAACDVRIGVAPLSVSAKIGDAKRGATWKGIAWSMNHAGGYAGDFGQQVAQYLARQLDDLGCAASVAVVGDVPESSFDYVLHGTVSKYRGMVERPATDRAGRAVALTAAAAAFGLAGLAIAALATADSGEQVMTVVAMGQVRLSDLRLEPVSPAAAPVWSGTMTGNASQFVTAGHPDDAFTIADAALADAGARLAKELDQVLATR